MTIQMRRNLAAAFYAAVLLGSADTVRAMGETNASSFCSPIMPAAPKIDGTINPAEWLGAQKLEGFTWCLERIPILERL